MLIVERLEKANWYRTGTSACFLYDTDAQLTSAGGAQVQV